MSHKLFIAYCLLFLIWSIPAFSEPVPVFITNYDVTLTVDKNQPMHIQNNSIKVRSGNTIPYVELGRYKVELRLSEQSPNRFSVDAAIFEKEKHDLRQISFDMPTYESELGIPLQFSWNSGDVLLDVALVVSIVSP